MRTAIVASLIACMPAVGAAKPCWTPKAAEAVAVRVLQSELTVGAIACAMPAPYASFVANQSETLRRHGAALNAFYAETRGEGGARAVDALVTRLANEASTRKVDWPEGYCEFMLALTERAASLNPDDLASFAASHPHAKRTVAKGACDR